VAIRVNGTKCLWFGLMDIWTGGRKNPTMSKPRLCRSRTLRFKDVNKRIKDKMHLPIRMQDIVFVQDIKKLITTQESILIFGEIIEFWHVLMLLETVLWADKVKITTLILIFYTYILVKYNFNPELTS